MFQPEWLKWLLLLLLFEWNFSYQQSGLDCRCQIISLTNTFYLLEPHHMNVELLLEPPFLVGHVGAKITVRFRLLFFAAVPLSQRKFKFNKLIY